MDIGSRKVNSLYLGSQKVLSLDKGYSRIYEVGGAKDEFLLLLNGFYESEKPEAGSITESAYRDSSCPIIADGGMLAYDVSKFSDAVNFRGASFVDWISKNNNPFTIEWWSLVPDRNGGVYLGGLYGKSISEQIIGFFIENVTNVYNYFQFYLKNPNGDFKKVRIDRNVWNHFALVCNGGSNEVNFYLNGVFQDKKSISNIRSFGMLRFRKIAYHHITQIAIRPRAVWTENFTPPTNLYTL